MIITDFAKKLEPGDKIHCQGMTVTVGETIYCNDYFQESDGSDNHYCEFIDTNGNYHYWKQGLDGGYVIPKGSMSDAEKMTVISTAFHKFRDIYDDTDLRKEGLSLSDYSEVKRLFPLLGKPGSYAKTIYKNAAEWFKRNGFKVYEDKIVGYEIAI